MGSLLIDRANGVCMVVPRHCVYGMESYTPVTVEFPLKMTIMGGKASNVLLNWSEFVAEMYPDLTLIKTPDWVLEQEIEFRDRVCNRRGVNRAELVKGFDFT